MVFAQWIIKVNKPVPVVQVPEDKFVLQNKLTDDGRIGKVTSMRSWGNDGPRELSVPAEMRSLPRDLDWTRFLGTLPARDWDPRQYLYFRAFMEFGGGMVTDLFTHWVDVAHMFTGFDMPSAATSAGGVYIYKDAAPLRTL